MSVCLVNWHHWVIGETLRRVAIPALKWFPCLDGLFCSVCVMIVAWDILDIGIVAGDEFFILSGCFILQFVNPWCMSHF